MLSPKKLKFRKHHRRFSGHDVAQKTNTVAFGDFGLVSLDHRWVNARQIEAARVAMTRKIKRGGRVWIRIFPHKSYTKKPAETRMGKGKGNVEAWIAEVKEGTVMFEMSGVPMELAAEAMALAGAKLPVRTKFVVRREIE